MARQLLRSALARSGVGYDAWGNVRLRGDLQTDIGHTVQREDAGINAMFYRARFYSPALGRFLSADTIVPNGKNSQAFNRYAYTLNNPLKYIDPSGHDVDCSPWDSACRSQVKVEKIIASSHKHPVFVDPSMFGFEAGVNVDILPYAFYLDPRQFDFTANIEWYYALPAFFATLLTPLIGQGSMPDKVGVDENYPVAFDVYCAMPCGQFDFRMWQRDIVVNGRRSTLFLADWQPVYYEGGLVMKETFDLPGQETVAAYLKAIVGDPSRPVGQKSPLTWETVGFDSGLV